MVESAFHRDREPRQLGVAYDSLVTIRASSEGALQMTASANVARATYRVSVACVDVP